MGDLLMRCELFCQPSTEPTADARIFGPCITDSRKSCARHADRGSSTSEAPALCHLLGHLDKLNFHDEHRLFFAATLVSGAYARFHTFALDAKFDRWEALSRDIKFPEKACSREGFQVPRQREGAAESQERLRGPRTYASLKLKRR